MYVVGSATIGASEPLTPVEVELAETPKPPSGPDDTRAPEPAEPDPYELPVDSSSATSAAAVLEESWLWEELGEPPANLMAARSAYPNIVTVIYEVDPETTLAGELPYLEVVDGAQRSTGVPEAVRPTCRLSRTATPSGDAVYETRTVPLIATGVEVIEFTIDLEAGCVLNVTIPPTMPDSYRDSADDGRFYNPESASVRRPDGWLPDDDYYSPTNQD